nr:NAD-dependent deacylase [uncultured Desulfobacter sp.]
MNIYQEAAQQIIDSNYCVAFTGAGISVESGIPPFRGRNGLWNKYDPKSFEIEYFLQDSARAWEIIRDIFYDLFGQVLPNTAHYALAEMEQRGLLKSIITQNIDNLHKDAGNTKVYEFHGSLKEILCLNCGQKVNVSQVDMTHLPPTCFTCGGLLKPDVVFFGEAIPEYAASKSIDAAENADCMILIGTTGTVVPANSLPPRAKARGTTIIEINPSPSEYTDRITDIFIQDNATRAMEHLMEAIDEIS